MSVRPRHYKKGQSDPVPTSLTHSLLGNESLHCSAMKKKRIKEKFIPFFSQILPDLRDLRASILFIYLSISCSFIYFFSTRLLCVDKYASLLVAWRHQIMMHNQLQILADGAGKFPHIIWTNGCALDERPLDMKMPDRQTY